MKRVVAFSAIAGVSLILCFSTPPVAQAAQENSRCAISTDAELGATACCVVYNYNVSGSDTRLPFPGVNMLTNGPGPNTSTFTRSINSTVNYQVVVGAESEVGAVLAKAKVSISASIGGSNSTSVTNSVTLVAPSGKYAHAQKVRARAVRLLRQASFVEQDAGEFQLHDQHYFLRGYQIPHLE